MDLFGMGMGEIVLVLVVALIIWGPGRMPEIARMLGKAVRTLKKASFDLTSQISKEVELEEKSRPSQSGTNSGDKPSKSSDVDMTKPDSEEGTSSRGQ